MAPLSLSYYTVLLSLAFSLAFYKLLLQRYLRTFKNLPPCPVPTLPMIGNLHHLKNPRLHRSLHSLSQKHGHIFSLWFGSRLAVVVSSQSLAQQCFTKHDTVLANRPRFLTGKHLFYNYTSLDSAPYGDHWRNLRRIITTDVLSTHRLDSFYQTRKHEAVTVVRQLAAMDDTCEGLLFARVELRSRLTRMVFNNMMRMVSGDDVAAEEGRRFREVLSEMQPLFGAGNKGEFLPLLRWLGLDGLEKRMKEIGKRADGILQGIVEEHRSDGEKKLERGKSMIQHLLTLQKSQPEYYSDHIIKGLIQGMFLGGTDTTSATIEWAMSALLNHPEMLEKAKNEIDSHIGQDRLVDESDIPNLPYLQNIIHETLRLYPPAPLLLPHFSSDECNIRGYTIPRDTIVMINAWTIQRDPEIWSDAACFKPERFEKEGEANKLMAFGLGRRACPGLGLAHRTVGLTLGLLIQCFEWKRLIDHEEIDMTENKSGVIMEKLIPLEAMCKPRPIIKKVMH